MVPLGESLGHIAPAAAMANNFNYKHKNTNKTQLLAYVYFTFFLANQVTFGTQKGPSTHFIDAGSCVKL
jgi:hypothetical protein